MSQSSWRAGGDGGRGWRLLHELDYQRIEKQMTPAEIHPETVEALTATSSCFDP